MKHIKKTIGLITGALFLSGYQSESKAKIIKIHEWEDNSNLMIRPLNDVLSSGLTAHRSHSSHGSHRSHRSGSSSYTPKSTPSHTPKSTPSHTPKSTPSHTPQNTPLESDPLGQPSKPDGTYKESPKADEAIKKLKRFISYVQYILKEEHGLYKGEIDGLMGPKTRKAIIDFQIKSK